jgi:Flp pilus assembly protein TadB
MPTIGNIALAFFGAVGAYIAYSALFASLPFSKKKIEWNPGDKNKRPPNALLISIYAFFGDFGKLYRPSLNVMEKMEKSGDLYGSIEQFYAMRVLEAIFNGLIVLFITSVIAYFSHMTFIMVIALSGVVAYITFFNPDRKLDRRLRQRRDQLLREMSFAMEQIVLIMQVKPDLSEALQSVRRFGMFGKICYEASFGLEEGKDMEAAIKKAGARYPSFPELEEFFDLLRTNREHGHRINEALKTDAEILRNNLSLDIVRRAASITNRVTMLASSYILSATLIPIFGGFLYNMM